MNNHHALMDIIKAIHRLSVDDIQGLANGLVWFSEVQAWRLKNCIEVSQQERDNSLTAQWDREQAANAKADQDAIFYGERI